MSRSEYNFSITFFFLWIVPLFWCGVQNGLSTENLTKCLDEDESNIFGDELEKLVPKSIVQIK